MLMAVAFPILPGKTAEWRAWMKELDGPRREEFDESRTTSRGPRAHVPAVDPDG